MNKNTQIFLAAAAISLPFWVGINIIEKDLTNIIFFNQLAKSPESLTAQALQQQIFEAGPIPKTDREFISVQGKGVLSLFSDEEGETKVLHAQNATGRFPIASLTKLMTALVAAKHYDSEQEVPITSRIVAEEGTSGFLQPGDIFTVQKLLFPLLIESSNDAAAALSNVVGTRAFVNLMNLEAAELGLSNTFFTNPTGLDPSSSADPLNYSSAEDLAFLMQHILTNYPEVAYILKIQEADLYTKYGAFHHTMTNTNELLGYTDWPTPILGGKTGWTPLAKESLALVLQGPKDNGHIIHVILGSTDRFGETKRLADWV
ncbi:MAG: serine hydrolase, partial [archaeon]|nr:serine hydrolase [archaeon]